MEWTSITLEEAKAHPLYGIGGWLLLILVVEGIGLTRAILGLPDLGNDSQIVVLLAVALVGLRLPFVVLSLFHDPLMPLATVICQIAYALIMWIMAFLSGDYESVVVSILVTAYGLVIILYVINSKRVKVTFNHRVKTISGQM